MFQIVFPAWRNLGMLLVLGSICSSQPAMAQADPSSNDSMYRATSAAVEFSSKAPLELIQAQSIQLQGILSMDGAFAFSIPLDGFVGFNSGLQREHFRENYLETRRYPRATFSGQMIDPPSWPLESPVNIRVRGMLTIHGVSRERILSVDLLPTEEGLKAASTFTVRLEDHGIGIPKIMYQKIAESVTVDVRANLEIR